MIEAYEALYLWTIVLCVYGSCMTAISAVLFIAWHSRRPRKECECLSKVKISPVINWRKLEAEVKK